MTFPSIFGPFFWGFFRSSLWFSGSVNLCLFRGAVRAGHLQVGLQSGDDVFGDGVHRPLGIAVQLIQPLQSCHLSLPGVRHLMP